MANQTELKSIDVFPHAMLQDMQSQQIQLYITHPHDCSYIPGQAASNLVPDPELTMTTGIYNQLIQLGYRRSGDHVYKPHCEHCDQCVPCRVPVKRFRTNRSQRRCLRENSDVSVQVNDAGFTDEYFDLYHNYLEARHPDGGMANPTIEEFNSFLYCDWCETSFIEFRSDRRLIAIAVTDRIASGLSAVYSFFDTEEPKRSLGTYCILKQIELAQELDLNYLYLGYWIDGNQKMRYKANFTPLELFVHNEWH